MTLTIYKFNYNFYGTTYSLCFSLSEETTKQIDDWNLSLDKIVLDEQLKTGSFQGKFSIDDDEKLLLGKMKDDGIIQPYYGMINARVCVFTLQVSPTNCKVKITHTVMEQHLSIEVPVSIYHWKLLRTLSKPKRGFMIKKQEYQTLSKWKFWNPRDAFTYRYKYTFSPTTIGVGKTILDVNTNEKIDITDYNDW